MRSTALRLGLLATSLLVALVVAELAVSSVAGLQVLERKAFLHNADCYRTDPDGRFPIDLRTDAAPLIDRVQVAPERLQELRDVFPHCVVYDVARRRTGPAPQRPETAYLIGDSFPFGEGLVEENTLAWQLAARYPDTNFRTFARSAANVDDVLQQAREVVAQGGQRLVYVFNLNDIDPRSIDEIEQGFGHDSPDERGAETCVTQGNLDLCGDLETSGWYPPRGESFGDLAGIERSNLYRLVQLQRVTTATVQRYLDWYLAPRFASLAQRTLDAITEMDRLVREAGGSFALVIHPLLHRDLWGAYPFEPVHALLLQHCKSKGIRCVDGAPAFADRSSMSELWVHPTDQHPNGDAVKALARFLAAKWPRWP